MHDKPIILPCMHAEMDFFFFGVVGVSALDSFKSFQSSSLWDSPRRQWNLNLLENMSDVGPSYG